MELGTLQIQIFVSLVVVLGTAFVAFLCDFLKGNNEQLRERNIELRVRQDERERMGVAHPGSLLKGIEALLRNTPGLRMAPPNVAEPAAPPAATPVGVPAAIPAETETPQPFTWEQPIVAPAPKGSAWASKEELEKLAERAARIRERHEARKTADDSAADDSAADDSSDGEPVVLAPVAEMPASAFSTMPAVDEAETPEPIVAEAINEAIAETPEAISADVHTVSVEELYAALETALPAAAESESSNGPEAEREAEPVAEAGPEPLKVAAIEPFAVAEAEPHAASTADIESSLAESVAEFSAPAAAHLEVTTFAAPDSAGGDAASQETPPLQPAELEIDAPASAEAEATPVIEPVAEAAAEEPASQIELQPPAIMRVESSDTPHSAITSIENEPTAIAPGPELVKLPMAMASLLSEEPEEPVAITEPAAAEADVEPELLRVRVVPIDQSGLEIDIVAEVVAESIPEPAAEAPIEVSAPIVEAQPEAAVGEEAIAAEEAVPVEVAEPVEVATTNVADLENAAGIGSLHESLVAEEAGLPPGLQPVELLREQIKSNAPFQGVAVSIGINDFEGLKQKLDTPGGADSLASIEKMIRGMLKERDFACRFQDDEYVLLFPGEADSAAQRRLFQISEKLWDFQLRSLGHHSIMFSWGGLEVKRDSLSDAVSSARERMFQTKRNRTGAIEMRKRVVNG